MGYKMKDKIIGLMPAEEFLLSSQIPDYDALSFTSAFTPGMFNNTLSAASEQNAYRPFINTIKSFAPQCSFINSHNNPDTVNCSSFTFNIKPDVCVYSDPTSPGTNMSNTEIIIEFKWGYCHDPFLQDSDSIISSTDNSMDTLGQITSYAAAQLGAQYHSHAFSVLIPHLSDFFHHYARAPFKLCGIDTSISPASTREAALAKAWLNLSNIMRMFKVSIPCVDTPGVLTLIIPQPTAFGFRPPVVIMFKDSWHISLSDVLPEGETYKLLKSHNVHNVATCIAYHDIPFPIPQQLDQAVKFSIVIWACPNTVITPHILHCLVLDISICDALIAHKDAHDLAKLLHRDLSVGNIVIHRNIGILIDWDLAKLITIQGPC
ncbi:hypothetical protein BDR07DRAFT_1494579 [Suillus spraguei]|nr:hypothetical protein BDR07DRAFT_1494579 [Suillus spraguei]